MAQSGVQSANQASATGGMGSMSLIGGFVRGLASGASVASPRTLRREGGDPSDGNGFYFDEWLGLWVQSSLLSNEFRYDFFEDEAKSMPAGHMSMKWPAEGSGYPQRWSSDFRFDAGTMVGSKGIFTGVQASEQVGSMEYDSLWAGSRAKGSSDWSPAGSTWKNRSDSADGSWTKDRGEFLADGSGVTHSKNSLGYASEYRWLSSGAGSGTIAGPDAGLPARIVWDASGEGTITYADGTSEEFHWWTVAAAGGGTGTGGTSGGGSSDGPRFLGRR
jgi:hypothetical protein